jgi:hypothetical protein
VGLAPKSGVASPFDGFFIVLIWVKEAQAAGGTFINRILAGASE